MLSIIIENWVCLWKKYQISLFLVSRCEATDSLFQLFFVNSSGECRLIRKWVWTRFREVSFWYESLLPSLIQTTVSNHSSSQIQVFSNVNIWPIFTHWQTDRQTDRLSFSVMTFRGHSFFFMERKKDSKSLGIASYLSEVIPTASPYNPIKPHDFSQ